jgi:hypothetical protein
LLQGLANTGHVSVAEDAPHSGEERLFGAIALNILILQEQDERLRHGESPGVHARPLIRATA